MIDVFVSYASADRERVAPLAQALLDHGWSVWWDRQIPPGKTFDEVIEAALDQAKVVLAVWTQAGVASPWVRTEAAEGAARGILVPVLAELVPVLAEDVRIPLAFRRIQAADLTDWAPGQEHPGFTELIDAINELTRIEPAEELQPPKPEDPVERAMLAAQARAAERDWEGVIGLLGPLEANTPGSSDAYTDAMELLALSRHRRDAAELYEEAEVLYADGRWHDVIARCDRLLEVDPDSQHGASLKTRAERHIEDERQGRLRHDYERAVEALNAREWPLAIARYQRILEEAPDYGNVAADLEKAQAGAASEDRYRDLQEMYRREQWDSVIAGMVDLAQENPDFGDPEELLAQAKAAATADQRHAAQMAEETAAGEGEARPTVEHRGATPSVQLSQQRDDQTTGRRVAILPQALAILRSNPSRYALIAASLFLASALLLTIWQPWQGPTGTTTTTTTAATGGETTTTAAGDTTTTTTGAPAEAMRIAVVAPSASNDLAFTQSMVDAVNVIAAEFGIPSENIAITDSTFVVEDAAGAIRDYANQGYDLVIAHGSQYGGSLSEIAPDFPETAFAWGTAADTFGAPNVFAYEAASDEGGYVMGKMAAALTTSSTVGIVGPVEVGDAKLYVDGFKNGAEADGSGVTVNINYTDSFSDVTLASVAATSHIAAGADVLTGTAQMVVGAISVADEAGVPWFGTQADQSSLAPDIVVASQVYKWEVVLRDILAQMDGGVLGGTNYVIDFENGGSVLEYNDAYPVPDEVKALADQVIADIVSGAITPQPAELRDRAVRMVFEARSALITSGWRLLRLPTSLRRAPVNKVGGNHIHPGEPDLGASSEVSEPLT